MAEVAGLSDAEANELCLPVDPATKVRRIIFVSIDFFKILFY